MAYFYISFATEEDFLGATVVEAKSPTGAVEEASRLGLNPGGEAAVFGLNDDFNPQYREHVPFIGRLVGKEEIISQHGGVRRGDMDPETSATFDSLGVIICEECNQT